eukprot:5874547-Pleurochrysis_carterae.AAC.1
MRMLAGFRSRWIPRSMCTCASAASICAAWRHHGGTRRAQSITGRASVKSASRLRARSAWSGCISDAKPIEYRVYAAGLQANATGSR